MYRIIYQNPKTPKEINKDMKETYKNEIEKGDGDGNYYPMNEDLYNIVWAIYNNNIIAGHAVLYEDIQNDDPHRILNVNILEAHQKKGLCRTLVNTLINNVENKNKKFSLNCTGGDYAKKCYISTFKEMGYNWINETAYPYMIFSKNPVIGGRGKIRKVLLLNNT